MKSKAKPAKNRRDRLKKQSHITSVQDLEKDILLFKPFFLTAINKPDNPLNPISEFDSTRENYLQKTVLLFDLYGRCLIETYGQKSSVALQVGVKTNTRIWVNIQICSQRVSI